MITSPQQIKLVLVEPLGPLNLGSIARLCENFGLNELRLVTPRCSTNDPDAIRMAVKGKKILQEAKSYPCLLDAIEDCALVIATCGRIDHGDIPLCEAKEAISWLKKKSKSASIALIFGREDRGLSNQELLLAHRVITIKTKPSYPSLNISHAVAIILYEIQNWTNYESTNQTDINNSKLPALPVDLNSCLKETESLLLDIGFLLEHTATPRISKLRSLLQRAETREEEIALIRGVIKQVRWAIDKNKK